MAATEHEREARKRRERRDSGCAHERKERRPQSEERQPPSLPPPPLHDFNRIESERRAERLSRARRPQCGSKRRRPQHRLPKHPKENDYHFITTGDRVHITNSSSPARLDYEALQKPPLSSEAETLDARALNLQNDDVSQEPETARVSAVERARQDERVVAPLGARRDPPSPDARLIKIIKKIAGLKKSIAKYESDFESQHGLPITPSDRMTDVRLTKMYDNLKRLQTEKKSIKTDPVEYALKVQAAKEQKARDEKLDAALKSDKHMTDLVQDIEEWLEGCRQAAGRSGLPESNWSVSQLTAEKFCVQRALLRLEAARGRPPAHSAERGAARHLYDRYRNVKRILATLRPDAIIMANGELATIHEHEAMLFNKSSSVDSSSDSQEKATYSSEETIDTPLQSPPTRDGDEVVSSTSSAQSGTTSEEVTPSNEGLHCLSLEELSKALTEAKLNKGVLRRSIKEYEVSFEMQNSRKVQRDDRKTHEDEYLRYKAVKARIKLLNALINKQKSLGM